MDYLAENYALHYLRTKEGHEVDFALIKDGNIEKLIEVKNSNHDINKSLYYFNEKYNLPALQIVRHLRQERMMGNIAVLSIKHFLSELFM